MLIKPSIEKDGMGFAYISVIFLINPYVKLEVIDSWWLYIICWVHITYQRSYSDDNDVIYYPAYPYKIKAQDSESSFHGQNIYDLIVVYDYTFHIWPLPYTLPLTCCYLLNVFYRRQIFCIYLIFVIILRPRRYMLNVTARF